jgi:RHS repeat-associated protein
MLRSSVTSYYDADGLGSVTSLSNSTGGLAQTYAYDSFGKETSSSGSLTNPFQYTARELDPETNLYEYRARYFDPSVGRFINEDPTRFEDDVNLFSYVGNDSVNLKDPLGLYKIDASCDCPSKDKLKKAEGSALGNLTFLTNTRMTACMRKKITNGTVKCARGKCENSDPKTGWAGLSLPKFGNTTQICVTAIGASDDFLACTIIHEFAHKCSIKSEGSIENVEHQVPWCAATVN